MKKKPELTRKEKQRVKELRASLKRKQIGSPTGLEPCSLTALVDRVRWALENPGGYASPYLTHLWKDLASTEDILHVLRRAMLAETDDHRTTILMKARSQRR